MIKEYRKDDVFVVWDNKKCIHSGICVRGLPKVFRPAEVPWIHPESDTRDRIVEQVHKCPSGALSIKKVE